jgi:cell division septation protein DedD
MADQISEDDILSMSDDDLANLPINPDLATSTQGVVSKDTAQEDDDEPDAGKAALVVEDKGQAADPDDEDEDESSKPDAQADEEDDENDILNAPDDQIDLPKEKKEKPAKDEADPAGSKPDSKAKKDDEPTKPADKAAEVPVDYEAAYKKLMTPFKASNKMIQLENIDEAIVLMQRGADYTKKMQGLAPNLKLMKMLENNGLLNEEKLSHFIDLEKKDPAALNKFLNDKNIDPFDLDPEEGTAYKAGNHRVSDEEMRFTGVLDDLKSTPEGRETINFIETSWDQESIKTLYKEPELMKVMDEHRSDGIFQQITSEMERRKTLGQIPATATFLQAYKAIGDELHQSGRLLVNEVPTNQPKVVADPAPKQPTTPVQSAPKAQQPNRQMIDSRAAAPKPHVKNDAAAKAAAPSRQSTSKANAATFNPLSMSDEEFAKFESQGGDFRI